jgi:hypothetical protein
MMHIASATATPDSPLSSSAAPPTAGERDNRCAERPRSRAHGDAQEAFMADSTSGRPYEAME